MAISLDQELVRLKGMYEEGSQAPLALWNKAVQVLKQHKMLYTQVISPSDLVTHPANRQGLKLSGPQVHALGVRIKKAGASLSKLCDATCFELPTSSFVREGVLEWNKEARAASNGMLPRVLGTERYATVSSSHTAAFCKAVEQQCVTNEVDLGGHGVLTMADVAGSDDVLETMLTTGWQWQIIPYQIEEKHDFLPRLASLALNCANTIGSGASELECGLAILRHIKANSKDKSEEALHREAIAMCMQQNPDCHEYLASIAKYASRFSGDGSLIEFVHDFAAQFSGCKIGGDFFTMLNNTKFESGPFELYIFIRAALLVTQLMSPSKKNGMGNLLSSADVSKMNKDKAALKSLENRLKEAWPEKKYEDKFLSAYGRLMVRSVLFMVGKSGKNGVESKKFTSLDEIFKSFASELRVQKQSGFIMEAPIEAASSGAVTEASKFVASIEDASSCAAMAQKAGFKVNKN